MSRPRHAPRLLPFLALLLGSFALSCTDPGATPWFDHPSQAPFTIVQAVPAAGAAAVALDQPVDIYLSDLPDPDSVSTDTFILRSSGTQFTGGFQVDLIDRRLRYLPARTLQPHLTLRVLVGQHLRTLDGRELGRDVEWGFTTGTALGGQAVTPPVVFDDVAPTLATRCSGCHEGAGAIRGLDLASADAAHDGLVGRASVERPELLRAAAGDHARSYLVRKLLGAPGIVGDRMPPPPEPPLDAPTLRRVATWIDQGAKR